MKRIHKLPAFSSGFLLQINLSDLHPFIHGLTHIVHRKESHRNPGKRLHLHTGFSHSLRRAYRLNLTALLIQMEIHVKLRQVQHMTQRNQLRSPFGPHDPGHPGYGQHIPFFHGPLTHHLKALRTHKNASSGHRLSSGVCFFSHIHHPRIALSVKMCKFHLTLRYSPYCHTLSSALDAQNSGLPASPL